MRRKPLFTKRKIYENHETVVTNIVWIRPHQYESGIVTMSSSFDMPRVIFVVREPFHTNAGNDST